MIPASLLAAHAPSDSVLGVARVLGSVSAGTTYPTTLTLITASRGLAPDVRRRSRCGRVSAALSRRSVTVRGNRRRIRCMTLSSRPDESSGWRSGRGPRAVAKASRRDLLGLVPEAKANRMREGCCRRRRSRTSIGGGRPTILAARTLLCGLRAHVLAVVTVARRWYGRRTSGSLPGWLGGMINPTRLVWATERLPHIRSLNLRR